MVVIGANSVIVIFYLVVLIQILAQFLFEALFMVVFLTPLFVIGVFLRFVEVIVLC